MKWLATQLSLVRQVGAALPLFAVVCVLVLSFGATGSVHAAERVKKVAKQTAKPLVKKAATKVTASRAEIRSKASQLAVGIQAAESALSPQELAIARLIHVGQVACELGVSINIKADARSPGYFDLESKQFKFRMFPVVSSTGAIRLQDARADAVWLQLSNKSMLMSQKRGSRLADVCMNPAQRVVAAEMEKNPPSNLLEPEKVAVAVQPSRLLEAEIPSVAAASDVSAPGATAHGSNLASVQPAEKVLVQSAPLDTAPAAATQLP